MLDEEIQTPLCERESSETPGGGRARGVKPLIAMIEKHARPSSRVAYTHTREDISRRGWL